MQVVGACETRKHEAIKPSNSIGQNFTNALWSLVPLNNPSRYPLFHPFNYSPVCRAMGSVPYIGAKISLISRSEIRYEGVLAEVDPREATISLEHVRMMGTEGRRKSGEEIPASQQIYDFVVFRSTDIKDLQVSQAPPSPQPQAAAFVDPAIVNVHEVYDLNFCF